MFDGNGLILLVRKIDTKTWRYKYKNSSGTQVITLGTYPALTLKEARARGSEIEFHENDLKTFIKMISSENLKDFTCIL